MGIVRTIAGFAARLPWAGNPENGFVPPGRPAGLVLLDALSGWLLTPIFGARCEICDCRSRERTHHLGLLARHPCCPGCAERLGPPHEVNLRFIGEHQS